MKLSQITFKQFTTVLSQFFDNVEETIVGEPWTYLPRRDSYPYGHLFSSIKDGTINELNFQDNWVAEHFIREYNQSICGLNYERYKKMYDEIIVDPEKIQILQDINNGIKGYWSYNSRRLKEQMRRVGLPSFYIFFALYNDTKSSFRHWWDTYNSPKLFKLGDMVELRSAANRNHIMKVLMSASGNPILRSVGHTMATQLHGTLLMVLAYDEQFSLQTYSYKKGKGGTRMVTLLPVGSTQKIYLVEQFLKVSRKKAVKEAKGKKK